LKIKKGIEKRKYQKNYLIKCYNYIMI